jgi:hypothetical protein
MFNGYVYGRHTAGPKELWAIECRKCGRAEQKILARNPLHSNAIGWLAGELGGPS